MKKILNFILIAVLFSGLVVPSQAGFLNVAKSANAQTEASSKTLVTVVATKLHQSSIVVKQSSPSLAISCAGAVVSGSHSLVGGADVINLNEPANCFTLELSKPVLTAVNLSVQPLNTPTQKIYVLQNQPMLSSPSVLPAPFVQNTPILPLTYFGLTLAYVLLERKHLSARVFNFKSTFKQALSLHKLQMLRC